MSKKIRIPFPRLRGMIASPASAYDGMFDVSLEDSEYELCGDAAIVDICGPLAQKPTALIVAGGAGFARLLDYGTIQARVLSALASPASKVILRIDSPGGDFAGSLECARALRAMAVASGKPLLAFTDAAAHSAAYAIACSAETLAITPSALVGSVGVWAPLRDEVAADAMRGERWQIVASGPRKADRNPHVPITDGAIQNLQVEVDAMAALFFDAVTDLRGADRSPLEALGGAHLFGASAVAAGLADVIVDSFEAFVSGEMPLGRAVARTEETENMGSFDEAKGAYRKALAKLAGEDSDEGKKARAKLAALDKEDEKEEAKAAKSAEKEGEPDGDEKAKGAEGEPEKKEEAKAQALASLTPTAHVQSMGPSANELALAARVQALEAEAKAEKIRQERDRLLSARPDFEREVRASLERAPLAVVREAVEKWPRKQSGTEASIEAMTPAATRGDTQASEDASLDQAMPGQGRDISYRQFFSERMGGPGPIERGVVRKGTALTLGYVSREEAAKNVARLEAMMAEVK